MSIDVHPHLLRSDLLRSDAAPLPAELEARDEESEAAGWVETAVTALAAAIAVLFVSFVSVVTAFA